MNSHLWCKVWPGPLHPPDALRGDLLADAVVGYLDADTGLWAPLSLRSGELPDQDVVWLRVTVDEMLRVKVLQSFSSLCVCMCVCVCVRARVCVCVGVCT